MYVSGKRGGERLCKEERWLSCRKERRKCVEDKTNPYENAGEVYKCAMYFFFCFFCLLLYLYTTMSQFSFSFSISLPLLWFSFLVFPRFLMYIFCLFLYPYFQSSSLFGSCLSHQISSFSLYFESVCVCILMSP